MTQPWEAVDDLLQHQRCLVTVMDVGGMDDSVDQIALGVGDDVALVAFDPSCPHHSRKVLRIGVVLTLWLSITPADGEASRPVNSRDAAVAAHRATDRGSPRQSAASAICEVARQAKLAEAAVSAQPIWHR